MRLSSVARQLSSDPWKYHVGVQSPFWDKVRKALVVNPESSSGVPLVPENRWPQPGSRPEKFTVPASRASDVAFNPYYLRDARRNYPRTAYLSQEQLSTILLVQGGINALPPPASSQTNSKALATKRTTAPSLASLYQSTSTGTFTPPTPPGKKYKWSQALDEHLPDGFRMWTASAKQIT